MPITIHLPTILAPFADGRRALEATGASVGEAVADVAARYPALAARLRDERGNPYPFVGFYLNERDIRQSAGFATAVQDGDELTIVPALAGG
jgi:molybdopterin converting factor small subunit